MFRKRYTREFKIRAVQLMGESSKPIRQLAEELGVSENNLYNSLLDREAYGALGNFFLLDTVRHISSKVNLPSMLC